jgi:AraC-like DNA-binding protein
MPGVISPLIQFYLTCCTAKNLITFDANQLELYSSMNVLNRYFENPARAKQSVEAKLLFNDCIAVFQKILTAEIIPIQLSMEETFQLNHFLSLVENYYTLDKDWNFYAELMNSDLKKLETSTIKTFKNSPDHLIELRRIRQSCRILLNDKPTLSKVAKSMNYTILEWKKLFQEINGLKPEKFIVKCSPENIKFAYSIIS